MFRKTSASLNVFLMVLIATAVSVSSGCDLGTYQKRLNEHGSGIKNVAPTTDSDTDEDTSSDETSQ